MLRAIIFALALAPIAAPVVAQTTPTEPSRATTDPALSFHLGYASLEKAESALEFGASAELGSYRTPRIRFAVGVNYLSSETERTTAPGSFSDLSANVDLRLKPFRVQRFVPFVGVGAGVHLLNSDYTEQDIFDIYDGVVVGIQALAGVMIDANETGRWGFNGEVRTIRAQNLDQTSFRAGLFLRL